MSLNVNDEWMARFAFAGDLVFCGVLGGRDKARLGQVEKKRNKFGLGQVGEKFGQKLGLRAGIDLCMGSFLGRGVWSRIGQVGKEKVRVRSRLRKS